MSFYSDFAEYYEVVFPFEEEVYAFLDDAMPRGTRRILDIGCGTGDYCGRFAERGFAVTGVDLDPWMIRWAEQRHGLPDFRVMGMQEVGSLDPPFELVYCIGNVASHLPRDEVRGFLDSVADLVSPGGAWVLQTVNWDYALSLDSFRFPDVVVDGGRGGDGASEGLVFERRYPEISNEGVLFATRLRRGTSTVFEGETRLYPLRSREYVEFCRSAGFELEGHYADFERGEFDPGRHSSSVLEFVKRA